MNKGCSILPTLLLTALLSSCILSTFEESVLENEFGGQAGNDSGSGLPDVGSGDINLNVASQINFANILLLYIFVAGICVTCVWRR